MTRFVGLLSLLALLAAPALAHDAPSGWEYGRECCSNADCAPADSVTETRSGWTVTVRSHPKMAEGEPPYPFHVARGDPRIKRSGDYSFHVCMIRDWTGEARFRLLCFYEAAGAS